MSKVKLKVVGGLAVDPDSDLVDEAHVYSDGKDAYTCVLGLSDVQTNKNSYYKIQLLESNNKNRLILLSFLERKVIHKQFIPSFNKRKFF